MAARTDISRFTGPLAVTALLLLASLFFVPAWAEVLLRYSIAGQYFRLEGIDASPVLSYILIILLLGICPLMFHILDRQYPLKSGPGLTLLYAVLVFSCTDVLCLSPFHLAATCFSLAMYCSIRASLEPHDADHPFASMMMLGTASLFFAPLVWIAPVMALMDNTNSVQKGKTIIGSICGLLLPMCFLVGIRAIATGFDDIWAPVLSFLPMTVDIDSGITQIQQPATMLKALVFAIICIWAVMQFMHTFSTLDIAQERSNMHCLVFALCLAVIAFLFGASAGSFPWILVMSPLSLFLYTFFNVQVQRRSGVFLLFLLLLITIAERIAVMM